eukprot:190365_1
MAVHWLVYVEFIESCIFIIFFVTLLYFHSNATYHAFKFNKERRCKSQRVVAYSFITLMLGLSYSISGVYITVHMHFFKAMNQKKCFIGTILIITTYGSFKIVSYLLFAIRLKQSFEGMFSPYPKQFYIVWECLIIGYAATTMCLFAIKSGSYYSDLELRCKANVPLYLIVIVLFGDFAICGVNLYLFIHPLCALADTVSNKRTSKKVKLLIRKNETLISISIATTIMVWLTTAVTKGKMILIYQSIDCVITSLCIVLLFDWNEKLFNIFCYFCESETTMSTKNEIDDSSGKCDSTHDQSIQTDLSLPRLLKHARVLNKTEITNTEFIMGASSGKT